jgi:hypothetical protein
MKEALTLEQIREQAPAAFKDGLTANELKKMGRTERYEFFDTSKIIGDMLDLGWFAVQAKNAGVQKKNVGKLRSQVTKHLLRFRNPNFNRDLKVGGLHPEILITNSHNGTSKFQFHAGLFRLVCSNGLVITDKTFERFNVKHINTDFDAVREYVNLLTRQLPTVIGNIDHMRSKKLKQADQEDFAIRALATRYTEYVDKFDRSINEDELLEHFNAAELLERHRPEDKGNDVWTVYNVIQENLIKGNFTHMTEKDGKNTSKRARSLEGEKANIDKMIDTNKGLWTLAQEFAMA